VGRNRAGPLKRSVGVGGFACPGAIREAERNAIDPHPHANISTPPTYSLRILVRDQTREVRTLAFITRSREHLEIPFLMPPLLLQNLPRDTGTRCHRYPHPLLL
jgi:hypothetical protein